MYGKTIFRFKRQDISLSDLGEVASLKSRELFQNYSFKLISIYISNVLVIYIQIYTKCLAPYNHTFLKAYLWKTSYDKQCKYGRQFWISAHSMDTLRQVY